jgi:hypothetical protein
MTRTSSKITRTLTSALVAAAVLAPNAGAATQDLRSPDARDAAAASQARDYQDLRSADARDAAVAFRGREYQDLRSPDARDATRVVSNPSLSTPGNEPSGSAWDEVGIGAAAVLGLMMIGLGGAVLIRRRRKAMRKSRVSVASG